MGGKHSSSNKSASSSSCGESKRQEFVEEIVCKESDVPENGMKEFAFGQNGGKVLVVKQEGELFAVGTKCSHYGAPLSTGTLGNGRVRCPWHGACFNLKTGDIEDFPGLDSIPCYKTTLLPNGDVKVCGSKTLLAANKREKEKVSKDPKSKETVVVIGGGAAGSVCAETLRQEGFTGRLVVLSSDKFVPYDRPKISKQLDANIAKIQLRNAEFYGKNDIEMLTNETVVSLDTKNKTVKTKSGKEFSYTKVFIGCGANARVPTFFEGYNLQNIFTIRDLEDANKIFPLLTPEKNVAVIGSSFIGMEAAAYCVNKVKSVTVFGRSAVPFAEVLGVDFGKRIAKLFETKGVQLMMSSKVEKFVGENGKLTHIVAGGVSIPADVCIVGLGVQYETSFLQGSGLVTTRNGTVEVDEYMQTNVNNVYAGGDVANAPVYSTDGLKDAIGHWQLAQKHGRTAALNMLGKKEPLKSVPFFFSMLFGNGIRYAGYGHGYDDTITIGDLENLKFVIYYCKGDEVVAAASIASDPIVAKFAELLYEGKKLKKCQVHGEWYK